MTERHVTQSRKDDDGDITALCNPLPLESWSPRSKAAAIADIETDTHRYYVTGNGARRVYVSVVDGPKGKYLRTSQDLLPKNNLDDLPDC